MEKHVLVIGGMRPVHKQLKKLGVRLSLMHETGEIKADDATFYDHVIGMPSTASQIEWVDIAVALQQHNPISAIGAYHEFHQDKAAAIAQALRLPFHSEKTILSTRQKDIMRSLLREAKVDITASQKVETTQDIFKFATTWGYPVILKPIDGWGSKGISVISQEDDIATALAWYSKWTPNQPMMVEQLLSGQEVSVEAFSEQGCHHILCITQKFKEQEHYVEIGHCLPAVLPEVEREAISRVVQATLTTLSVANGPTHTEVIMTQQGPRIVETHTRLGGDNIPELYELVSNVNLMELWARQTMGEQISSYISQPIPRDSFAAIWYVTPQAVGTLTRIEGEKDARDLPGVTEVQASLQPGQQLEGVHDSFSRGAYAMAKGQSSHEALERARTATEKLRFLVSWPN